MSRFDVGDMLASRREEEASQALELKRPDRRQRWRKLWRAVAVSVLVLGVAAGAGAWYAWTGTVYSSLQRLEWAIRRHDRYLFEKHVDLQHLTRRLIDDFLESEIQELEKHPMSALEQVGASLGMTFVQLIKPRLMEEITYSIGRGVETGELAHGNIKPQSQSSKDKVDDAVNAMTDDFPKLKPAGRASVRVEEDVATVALPIRFDDGLPNPATPETLQIRFVRTPERYWRATEIENMKDILRLWHEREAKRLEAANESVRTMLQKLVTVVSATKEQGLNLSGTGKDAWVVVVLKNNAASTLRDVVADVTIEHLGGGRLKKVRIQDDEPITGNETGKQVWVLGLDLSDETDRFIYEADASRLAITVELQRLVFADGMTVKIAESLDEVAGKPGERKPAIPPPSSLQSL